jgi:hypothetical protein
VDLREAAVLSVGLSSGGWMDGWMEHIEAGGTGTRGKVAGVGWDALDLTLLVHILEEDETLPCL